MHKYKIDTFHVITSTDVGGAERVLEKFLAHDNSSKNTIVISLSGTGLIGKRIIRNGILVEELNLKSYFSIPKSLKKYHRLMRLYRPTNVIGWMYHANLWATIYSALLGGPSVVWNIRCGLSDYESWPKLRKLILKASRHMAYLAKKIIYNSNRACEQHIRYGFDKHKHLVIYNGFNQYATKNKNDRRLRMSLGIPENTFLIGSFGRNSKIKRMEDILYICKGLHRKGLHAHILFVGRDFNDAVFLKKVKELDIGHYVHIVDETSSLPPYYSILDVFCLCSIGEGFPNVIGEAINCNIPVLCSDISDLKEGFLQEWQIHAVGDISGFVKSAYRIYKMTNTEIDKMVEIQKAAFMSKTKLSDIIPKMNKTFFDE